MGCTAATMAAASGERSGQSDGESEIAFVRRGLRLEGTVRARTSDYGGALAAFQCSALWAQRTAWAKLTASTHVDAALDEAAAGAMLARLGRYADARAALERALQVTQTQLDVSAPLLGRMRSQLALLSLEAGELLPPLQLADAAAALLRHAKGPTHPDVVVPLRVRCLALRGLGRGTQALKVGVAPSACPQRAPLPPPRARHPVQRDVCSALTACPPPSMQACAEALALGEAALGALHPTVAILLHDHAEVLRDVAGQPRRAWRLHERAWALQHAALPISHPDRGAALSAMGATLLQVRRRSTGARSLVRSRRHAVALLTVRRWGWCDVAWESERGGCDIHARVGGGMGRVCRAARHRASACGGGAAQLGARATGSEPLGSPHHGGTYSAGFTGCVPGAARRRVGAVRRAAGVHAHRRAAGYGV